MYLLADFIFLHLFHRLFLALQQFELHRLLIYQLINLASIIHQLELDLKVNRFESKELSNLFTKLCNFLEALHH